MVYVDSWGKCRCVDNVLEVLYFVPIVHTHMVGLWNAWIVGYYNMNKGETIIFIHTWLNHLNFKSNILHHCSLAACIILLCVFNFCSMYISVHCMIISGSKQHDNSWLCVFSFNMFVSEINGLIKLAFIFN